MKMNGTRRVSIEMRTSKGKEGARYSGLRIFALTGICCCQKTPASTDIAAEASLALDMMPF